MELSRSLPTSYAFVCLRMPSLTLLVKQARKKLFSIMSNMTTLKNIPRTNEKAPDLAAHILNGEANTVKWKIDSHKI
jgi:hypothetical protein